MYTRIYIYKEIVMQTSYVAKKSAWSAVSIWHILLCWLVVPIIIMIIKIAIVKSETIEFSQTEVISRRGILSKSERHSSLSGIRSVSVSQSLWGRMFNFGEVTVDIVGKWDVDLSGISNPTALKEYLLPYVKAGAQAKYSIFE